LEHEFDRLGYWRLKNGGANLGSKSYGTVSFEQQKAMSG
jgi:hypothetical protein